MKKLLLFIGFVLLLSISAFAVDDTNFAANEFTFTSPSGVTYYLSSQDNSQLYFYLQYVNDTHTEVRVNALAIGTGNSVKAVRGSDGDTTIQSLDSQLYYSDKYSSMIYYRSVYLASVEASFTPFLVPFGEGVTGNLIVAAFEEFVENPPVTGTYSTFIVPRGNVLYFRVSQPSAVKFESAFADNSAVFGGNNVYGPWGDTGQRIKVVQGLPSAGTSFPLSESNAISWEKAPPYNVLGQSKNGTFSLQCGVSDTWTFYNPAYVGVQSSDGSFGSTSVGSNVTVSGYFSFLRIYSLQQLMDTSTSNDDYVTYVDGTPQENTDTVVWTDQDDNVSAPVSGGDNQDDEPISSINLIDGIKQILRNILTEIENIFTFGFSAIRSLVELMREFLTVFDGLYTWLPTELHALLFACVSVAIVIGIFKVFL